MWAGAHLLDSFAHFIANARSGFGRLGSPFRILIGLLCLIVCALVVFWLFNEAILYFTAKSYVDDIAWVFDINRHAANALALGVFVLLTYLAASTFSFDKTRRRIGYGGVIGLLIANSLLLWQGSKSQYFDKAGSSTKCYVLTRSGQVKYLERAGVDPESGRPCRPYTADMLERLKAYESGKRPMRIAGDDPVFFDPRTGEPIVWFAMTKSGQVELFDLMGFHPDTGEELQAATRDVADAYKRQVSDRNRRPPTLVDIVAYAPFDPVTGQARIWFWQGANGEYEFYDNRGFHPRTGEQLVVISRDVLADYNRRASQRCYVITKDSVRYGGEPGIDPATGRQCRQLTAGLLERVREYEKGNRPKPVVGETPTFFDLRTGDPALWYSKDSAGRLRLFDLMGFDPQTGDELIPVTKDIPAKWAEQIAKAKIIATRRLKPPQPIDPDKYPFFDPVTGEARVWFWRSSDGQYEFFDNEGFHPRTGEPLKVITKESIASWRREAQLLDQRRKDEAARLEQQKLQDEERARRIANSGALCDQAAANPNDTRKPAAVAGVRYEELKMQSANASEICRIAVENNPNEPRYQYQYARALGVLDQDKAIAIYRQLTRQRYPAAFDNLANLLWKKQNLAGAIAVLKDGAALNDPDSMVTLAEFVERGYAPSANPQATKLALLSKAAQLGHQGAQLALEQEKVKLQHDQQQQAFQAQQQQMMLNMFGSILRGIGSR
jgi:hypothetical protein